MYNENKDMSTMENKVNIKYNTITRKEEFSFDHQGTLLVPHPIPKIIRMEVYSFQAGIMKMTQVVDIDPIDSLYAYCNGLKYHVVGESQTPLLRIMLVKIEHSHFHQCKHLCTLWTWKPDAYPCI